MEDKTIALVLASILFIVIIALFRNTYKMWRLAELTRFCQQRENPDCGPLINRVDLERLEVQRYSLYTYFIKFVEAGDPDILEALYLSWQTVKNPKKKNLCQETFNQAILTFNDRALIKPLVACLLKSVDSPKLTVTDAIIKAITKMGADSKKTLYLGVFSSLHDFRADKPEHDGFVFVTLLKLKKALNV